MALDQSALLELLDALKAAGVDAVVRNALEAVLQALIDAEATAVIGAEPHQRSPERVTQRNGYRDRLLTTAAGDLELRIPKLRTGSFFPSLLQRRRRIDQDDVTVSAFCARQQVLQRLGVLVWRPAGQVRQHPPGSHRPCVAAGPTSRHLGQRTGGGIGRYGVRRPKRGEERARPREKLPDLD